MFMLIGLFYAVDFMWLTRFELKSALLAATFVGYAAVSGLAAVCADRPRQS